MTIPAFLFGVFISSFIGACFHLWKDGGVGRLILYLIFSGIGFWVGHILAGVWKITFFSVGPLHLGFSLIMCLVFLGLGYWLSLIDVQKIKK
jgi:hypothetical protein